MHIVLMLAGGVLGGVVSWNKGRNVFLWTILCGVMPLFVLLLVALPRIPREGVWRPCPFCLKIIPWQAHVCAYCQRDVPPPRAVNCRYCNTTIWAGQDVCPRCGQPAPWSDTPKP